MSKRTPVGVQTFDIWSMGIAGEASSLVPTLVRFAATGPGQSATEVVTFVDLGGGNYRIAFTPEHAEYYKLRVQHLGGASPTGREVNYDYQVETGLVGVTQIPVNVENRSIWSMGIAGEAANIATTLYRTPPSEAELAADETVTVEDLGGGDYALKFTPTWPHYYRLEALHTGTGRRVEYRYDVQPAEAVAYANEDLVVAYAQMGYYTTQTIPTVGQVRAFMSVRASAVYARLGQIMSDEPPGPLGYDIVIDKSTDRGKNLATACAEANAIGAAIDALQAAKVQTEAVSERITLLEAQLVVKLEALEQPAKQYRRRETEAQTHISTGESFELPPDEPAPSGLPISERIRF